MNNITFEWDEQKAWTNEQKHGVSFDEAQTAFYDDSARISYDPEHSQNEDRYLLLGVSASLRLVVVCHVYRQNGELIRIISVRKANKQEQQQYWSFI